MEPSMLMFNIFKVNQINKNGGKQIEIHGKQIEINILIYVLNE